MTDAFRKNGESSEEMYVNTLENESEDLPDRFESLLYPNRAVAFYKRFTANATGLDPVDEANMKLIQTIIIMPL